MARYPKLACLLLCITLFSAGKAQTLPRSGAEITVRVDLARTMGAFEPVVNWFGFDESNYASMPYGEQLLRELHDLSQRPSTSARITCSPRATACPS